MTLSVHRRPAPRPVERGRWRSSTSSLHDVPPADPDTRQVPLLLPAGLAALAACLVGIAVLGPLLTGVLQYRYSETMLNQAIGLDAVSLCVVAPIALVAAVLTRQGHRAGPLLALGPAAYTLYMMVQYVIGPEYLTVPGNGERGFPLFVVTFVLAATVLAQAATASTAAPVRVPASRRRGLMLCALALGVIGGMYLANGFLWALSDFPGFVVDRAATSEYDEHPTAYWIVAFLDLAVVVPMTVATGVGLLRNRDWAGWAFYGVVGWFALVPTSVAAMALVMVARDDPAASPDKTIVFAVVASGCVALAVREFRRLLRPVEHRPEALGVSR